jgi:V/A-type H+-transporting ATPase subunit I
MAVGAWYLYGFVRRNQIFRVDYFKLRVTPDQMARILRILNPMIAWTLVWGVVYGECFGDLLQKLGVFATNKYPGLIPVMIDRTNTMATATMLILVNVGFGTFQVLHGLALKAYLGWRQGEKQHFWEGLGYFCGVSALVLFSYYYMSANPPHWLVFPTLAGFVMFGVGVALARMPLMVAELPTQGGHILSYIRIYAMGLASAVLADLATNIGFGISHEGGFLGFIGVILGGVIGIIIGLSIHFLLTVLLITTHALQPIRLIWVEFFTKFDFYSMRGRPYRPFKLRGSRP